MTMPNSTSHFMPRAQAKAFFMGRANLLPQRGTAKPQPGDLSGQYWIGQTADGRFYTETRTPRK